jgi:hypothetical protein
MLGDVKIKLNYMSGTRQQFNLCKSILDCSAGSEPKSL